MGFVANFIRFPAVQKVWISAKTWQSYGQLQGGNFFWDTVYISVEGAWYDSYLVKVCILQVFSFVACTQMLIVSRFRLIVLLFLILEVTLNAFDAFVSLCALKCLSFIFSHFVIIITLVIVEMNVINDYYNFQLHIRIVKIAFLLLWEWIDGLHADKMMRHNTNVACRNFDCLQRNCNRRNFQAAAVACL